MFIVAESELDAVYAFDFARVLLLFGVYLGLKFLKYSSGVIASLCENVCRMLNLLSSFVYMSAKAS